MQTVYIAVFGLIGIFTRYGLDVLLSSVNQKFPISTLLINILGCFFAGLIFNFGFSATLQMGLLVGFCGGFTTFSAYALQVFQLMDKGNLFLATIYFSASPILGAAGAYAGVSLAKKIF